MADEYDDAEDQGSEGEEPDPVEEPVEGDTVPRAQYDKVVREARSTRTKLRRTELAAEFGADVVELVPDSLPLKEQRELAEKLKAKFGSTVETQNEQGAEQIAESAVEQPTEQERRAAALARSGSGSPVSGFMNLEDWHKLSVSNPEAAQAAFKAGHVDFSGLREGLGASK